MKKLLIVAVLALSLLSSGCGMTDSFGERVQRYENIHYLQARMLVDQWDYLWLYDRATALSPWYITIAH